MGNESYLEMIRKVRESMVVPKPPSTTTQKIELTALTDEAADRLRKILMPDPGTDATGDCPYCGCPSLPDDRGKCPNRGAPRHTGALP